MGTFKRNWFIGIVNLYIFCKNYYFVIVLCKNFVIMLKILLIIKFIILRLFMWVEIMFKVFSNWVKIFNF